MIIVSYNRNCALQNKRLPKGNEKSLQENDKFHFPTNA